MSAEQAARKVLQKQSAHVGALTVLGLALSAQRRPADALEAYRALSQLEPAVAAHWSNLGNALCELGREHEALAPLQRASELGGDDAAVHFGLARAYATLGPLRAALAHADRAITFDPRDVEFRLLRAKLLVVLDDWESANLEIDRLLEQSLDVEQQVELGYLFLHGGLYTEAMQTFDDAMRRDPGAADALIGTIMTLERVNRIEEAERLRARLDSDLGDQMTALLREKLLQVDSRLAMRRGEYGRASDLLQALLATKPADPALYVSLEYELGAAYDKCGQVAIAIAAFQRAHAARKAQIDDNHPALARSDSLYVALEEPLPHGLAMPLAPDTQMRADPIFVVGFPRSGTTLLEQLLDTHPDLASFDEQPFVQRLVKRLVTRGEPLAQAMARLSAAESLRLREFYFKDVATVVPDLGRRRPVDKNPLNLVRLPLVQHFFPHARVVLAVRHPCDVVLSCYMQNFRAPAFAVTFETLESCAEMYDRVFTHWWAARDDFKLPIHTLRYEDLVTHTEREARALFEFLEAPWLPELMRFTEHARRKGVISTPSYMQVVQPVYTKSIGRWEAYRSYFNASAIGHLAPWLERFGYHRIEPR